MEAFNTSPFLSSLHACYHLSLTDNFSSSKFNLYFPAFPRFPPTRTRAECARKQSITLFSLIKITDY